MKLVKVHSILRFKLSNQLKSYTEFILKKDKKIMMNLIKSCIN